MIRKNVIRGVLAASIFAMMIGMSGQNVKASEFDVKENVVEVSEYVDALDGEPNVCVEPVVLEEISADEVANDSADVEVLQDGEANDDSTDVAIDEANFPDAIFREYVSSNFDTNKDHILSKVERENVEQIDCQGRGITSLQGVEYFPRMTQLDCRDNQITAINLTDCGKLANLYCHNNALTSLDVTKNEKLQKLSCYGNPLKELNLNTCTELTYLAANDCELTSLNVGNCSKLTNLYCHRNQLTELILGQHNYMTILNIGENNLDYINIGGCPTLIELTQKAELRGVAGNENGRCYVIKKLNGEGKEVLDKALYFDKSTRIFRSEPVTLTLSVKEGRKGYVSGGGLFEIGDEVTIVATPMKGNRFKEWWINHSALASTEATYTFVIGGDTAMTAVFGEIPMSNIFEDVDQNAWYVPFIRFVYEREIMSGKGKKTPTSKKELFSPLGKITRAEFATTLYNMEKRPVIAKEDRKTTFLDVKIGEWYGDPIIWLFNNKIASGYSSTQFGSFDNISREQMAQMLYTYSKMKNYDTSVSTSDLTRFGDYKNVSSWAKEAMIWATENKIINGDSSNPPKLNPKGDATRAECATMLNNLYQRYEAQAK